MFSRRNVLLGSAVLLAILILFFGATATAAQTVPATAREAAKLPQFAAKLAHPTASYKQAPAPAGACSLFDRQAETGLLPSDGFYYSNGPINGTTDAWGINFGFVVSNSISVSGGNATGLSFGAWLFPGDVLQSVEIKISTQPFGGAVLTDQIVTFSQSNCSGNQYGFNICTESGTLSSSVSLSSGTYWVSLQNATVNTGDPVYWDENSGPSMAEENSVGTIPSEAFTLTGGGNACIPQQQGGFRVIRDLSGNQGGPASIALDAAGNVYAATQWYSPGTVFKLAAATSEWLSTTLYNFLNGDDGAYPNQIIVGPHGILYGSASGGIHNCGSGGAPCGLIFGLRPSSKICFSGPCPWTETVIYRFTGPTDAANGTGLIADSDGNLYGVSTTGGANEQGAVFELSPSAGPWVESILYSFTGGSNGAGPTSLLLGTDGNLYGLAGAGGANNSGVVFRLSRSGSGWTETVLADLPYSLYATQPHSLVQDSAGNLFGEWNYWYAEPIGSGETLGVVFELSPSNGGWTYTELARGQHQFFTNDVFGNLAVDGDGTLWGTGGGAAGCVDPVFHGYIFKLARDNNNNWQYSNPVYWDHTKFDVSSNAAIDTHGNLFGTTIDCGAHGQGTVWEFTPQ